MSHGKLNDARRRGDALPPLEHVRFERWVLHPPDDQSWKTRKTLASPPQRIVVLARSQDRARQRPEDAAPGIRIREWREVLRVDRRAELSTIGIRTRHDHAKREVRIPIEQSADPSASDPCRALHPRVVVEAPHPAVQHGQLPDEPRRIEREGKRNRSAEVVYDQRYVLEAELSDELAQHARMGLRIVLEVGRAAGETEAEMVDRNAPVRAREVANGLTPLERPCRRAVHEEKDVTDPLVDVMHEDARANLEEPALEWIRRPVNPPGNRGGRRLAHAGRRQGCRGHGELWRLALC